MLLSFESIGFVFPGFGYVSMREIMYLFDDFCSVNDDCVSMFCGISQWFGVKICIVFIPLFERLWGGSQF